MSFWKTALLAGFVMIAVASIPSQAYIAAPALTGARIDGVAYGSPAQRVGVEVGDVIVAIDNQPIRSVYEFNRLTEGKSLATLLVRDWRTGGYVQTIVQPRSGRIGVHFKITTIPEATIRDLYKAGYTLGR